MQKFSFPLPLKKFLLHQFQKPNALPDLQGGLSIFGGLLAILGENETFFYFLVGSLFGIFESGGGVSNIYVCT